MVLPVSVYQTGMDRWYSDVSGVHHSASPSFENFCCATCASVTVKACLSCDRVRLDMGCTDVWYWERVRRSTGSLSGSFLGFTLGAGAVT